MFGWGGGGSDYGGEFGSAGGDGCGGCGYPESIEEEAKSLRKSFEASSLQALMDQQILGTLCENHVCGTLSEIQASRLLDRAVLEDRYAVEQKARNEEKWMTRLGIGFAAAGLLIAWLSFRQSQEADRRSVRNEVEINHLKAPEKS
ncbi:hypothetical protein [Rhodovulum sp. MB263]|uniref:hypothetical protein n=1 Tax=Rhodovulum sp. (strain MB263) TaxID=308754 RepID=UPI0012DB1D4E|nr:hypothetical protein [Rhodovulum sp. MB263]